MGSFFQLTNTGILFKFDEYWRFSQFEQYKHSSLFDQ